MAKARPKKGGQGGSPAPAHPRKLRRYYAVFLVVATASTIVLWLLLHLARWYSERVGVVGSSLTALVTVGGLAWGLLRKFLPKEIARTNESIDRKVGTLNRRELAPLTLGLVVCLCLFATTGSIHLNYEGGEGVPEEMEISISRGEAAPFLGPFRLSKRNPSRLKFFWTPPWRTLTVQILRPRLWETESVQIGWKRAAHFTVSKDFRLRPLFLLGLVPGEGLYRYLPDPEDGLPSYYDLTLRVGGKTHRIPGLRRERILLGPGVEEMQIVAGQGAGEWDRRLERDLKRKMPETFEDSSQHPLLANRIRFVPVELRSDDVIERTITKKGNNPQIWRFPPRKVPSASPWTFLDVQRFP